MCHLSIRRFVDPILRLHPSACSGSASGQVRPFTLIIAQRHCFYKRVHLPLWGSGHSVSAEIGMTHTLTFVEQGQMRLGSLGLCSNCTFVAVKVVPVTNL